MRLSLVQIVLGVLLAGVFAATAAAECLPGDLPCFCTEKGGEWRAVKPPLKPVCTYKFQQYVNGKGEAIFAATLRSLGFAVTMTASQQLMKDTTKCSKIAKVAAKKLLAAKLASTLLLMLTPAVASALAEMTRYFNVFLPAGFRSDRRYPVWMHIHGVYWGSMDDISRQMGWNVLAMDATANWDGLVGSDKVYNSAIVVYPQSTPSPYEDTSKRMVRLAM